jgi:biotin transport system permease protein
LWRLPDPALIVLALASAVLCFSLGGFVRAYLSMWKAGLAFVLVWATLKFLMDILGAVSPTSALSASAGLGLRLSTLLLLGLTLALSATPRRLGLGLAWFLRPLLKDRAWQIALALSLMIHFLPLTWATAAGLLQNLSRRWPNCPWRKRVRLVPLALLRVMSQMTWNQAVAVAARCLDQPEAWRNDRAVRLKEWAIVLIPGLVLLALAMSG